MDKATGGALNLSHYVGKYQVEHYVRTHHKDSFPVQSFGTYILTIHSTSI